MHSSREDIKYIGKFDFSRTSFKWIDQLTGIFHTHENWYWATFNFIEVRVEYMKHLNHVRLVCVFLGLGFVLEIPHILINVGEKNAT